MLFYSAFIYLCKYWSISGCSMLRSTVRGACLLLVLIVACSAAPNPDDPNAILTRERRTYGHYNVRSCGRPGYPKNGWSLYSHTTKGSKVIHYCKAGYLLVGAKLRICQSNRRWTPSLPRCKLVDCGDPGKPANGMKWLGSTTLRSYVKYECRHGYRLVGNEYRKCLSSGKWSGHLPTCRGVGCPALKHPRNGRVKVSKSSKGFTATYSCNRGYILQGSSTRTCVRGVWQARQPVCHVVDCGHLDAPENGAVRFENTAYPSIAHYQCNQGYILRGTEKRRCQANREWSGVPPICNAIDCPTLRDIANGNVVVRSRDIGSTAEYRCNTNYILQGKRKRTCQANREWSDEEPFCQAIECPTLRDIANGNVVVRSRDIGSTAEYRCNTNYILQGKRKRTCQANREWSDEEPFCQVVQCPELSSPANGLVSVSGLTPGSEASYSCKPGYRLEGSLTRTCLDERVWSSQEPACVVVTCGRLRPPKDGRVFFSSTSFGAEASYECIPGFKLVGVEVRTCQANGEWSEEEPSCQRIDCGLLQAPKNGGISFSRGTVFGSVATYNCDSPYQLEGVVTRGCQTNGEWSGEAPACESLFCDELDSPDKGSVIVPSRLPGSTATYSCNEGYKLFGSQTRSCQTNGFWSGVAPLCQPSDCSTLRPPTNGEVQVSGITIGSIANYECFDGFSLEGNEIRTCVDGGVWSGVEPVCTPIDCRRLENIPNGFVEQDGTSFGSTASYTCKIGYVLTGKGIRQCIENGQWSGDEPACEEIDCGPLDSPDNGEVVSSGTGFGHTATYSCNEGFTPVGTLTRICQITSEWSEEAPTCVANQCPDLKDPARGSVVLTGRGYQDTATYSCEKGYVVSGEEVRTCQSNGLWSGSVPSCILVDCGQPPFLQNGQFSLTTGTFRGAQATYSCFSGYRLIGSTIRTCLNTGEWSQEPISCQIIDCGILPPIPNGGVTFTSTTVDSQARYNCDSGFELVGVEIRICQADRQWSPPAPSCTPRRVFTCNELAPPANGEVSISGFTEGSVASYSCNRGYILVGSPSRRCLDPQGWSGNTPACHPVDCGVLEPPLNGKVMLMGTTVGSLALYNCDLGHILLGSAMRKCDANGEWSGSEPVCGAVECGGLPNPANGLVTLTGVVLGSVATYSCRTGFSLRGSATRECGRSGRWTGVAPNCESSTPDNCGDPGTPVSGSRIGDDFRVGATVYYKCDSGFVLEGPGSRQCQPSGIWTEHLPKCVKVTQTCEEGSTVYDDCLRRCTCRGGVPVNCCRVRRDFATLTIADRQRYIQTVLTVAKEPTYKPKYEALVAKYQASFDGLAQSTDPAVSQFFSWNRFYLLQYEDLLQEVDCRVTLPYWDWTVLPTTPYLAAVWSPDSGFGDSARATDGCVENGPFRFDLFEVTQSAEGGCLRRDYRLQMYPTRAIIEQDLLTLPAEEYSQFHRFLQIFVHINVRCFVGGQMCSDDAANDPVFLLHLAQIDAIFSRWQAIDSDRFSAAIIGDNRPLAQAGGELTVSDFGDISELPDSNSVCYEASGFKSHIPPSMHFLAQSLEELTNSEHHMTCVTDEEMRGVSMDTDTADYMHKECSNSDG